MTAEEKPQAPKPSLRSENDVLRLYELPPAINIDPQEVGKIINSILGDDINALMKEVMTKASDQTQAVNQAEASGELPAKKGEGEMILVDDLVSVGNPQKGPEKNVKRVDEKIKAPDLFQVDSFDDDGEDDV
ncbi:hypothetical protein KEM54_003923, partial [Ascosphaera aggregata]